MHEMNIIDRKRDAQWALDQFDAAEFAFVAVNGENGTPYNVPMCIFRVDDDLYFHTAMKGHINDLLRRDSKVCISCVPHTERDPENTTMRYRSAMVFGDARLVEEKDERMRIIKHFFDKYLPGSPKEEYYIDRMSNVALLYRVPGKNAVGKESLPGHNV